MAIYNFTLQTIARSDNRSAVAAAAYRAGAYLRDENTGIAHDLSKRRGIVSRIVLPTGVLPPERQHPSWTHELRSRLWNGAERAEKRINSVVAREIVIALPHELSIPERALLGTGYGQWLADRYRVAVDIAWHPPSTGGDRRNVHLHLQFTTREIGDDFAFGPKTRVLDAAKTGGREIVTMRAEWATQANDALAAAGLEVRIDHRSLVDRGIDREPNQHLGPMRTNMLRAAKKQKARWDAEIQAIDEELEKLRREVAAEAAQQEDINEVLVTLPPAVIIIDEQEIGALGPYAEALSGPEATASLDADPATSQQLTPTALNLVQEAWNDRNEEDDRVEEEFPYEPPEFDWAEYHSQSFRAWATSTFVYNVLTFGWYQYNLLGFNAWARNWSSAKELVPTNDDVGNNDGPGDLGRGGGSGEKGPGKPPRKRPRPPSRSPKKAREGPER